MKMDSILTNILSIAGAGLLILLTGLSFLLFRDFVTRYIRFFLPIPPIGVAAYIFVFNMFQHYEGNLTSDIPATIKEIILSMGVIALTFGAFTVLLTLFISTFRKFL